MIVAGFGCRKGVSADDVRKAFEAAVHQVGLSRADIDLLAAPDHKRAEVGLVTFAGLMARPMVFVCSNELAAAVPRTLSDSPLARAVIGVSSAAEAAALAVAGPKARLLAPRLAIGGVTCALADLCPPGRK